MTLYLRLAWRNIWRHRRRTVIIVLAMGLALAMMMMYDGLVDGFNNAIYGNASRVLGGNIQIRAEGYREKVDSNPLIPLPNDEAVVQAALAHTDVTAAFRRIQTGGLISSREGAFPMTIIGIDAEAEASVSLIAEHIADGRYIENTDEDSILIGQGLAEALSIQVGDRVNMVGSDIHKQNRQRTMTVIGIYDIGIPSMEKATSYISLAEAQNLFGLRAQSTEIQITLERVGTEATIVNTLTPLLPGYEVESWYGAVAPRATPPAIVERLNGAINKILQQPDMKKSLEAQGVMPTGGTLDQFNRRVRSDYERWLTVVKQAGIKPEFQEYGLEQANQALVELKQGKIRGAKVLRL